MMCGLEVISHFCVPQAPGGNMEMLYKTLSTIFFHALQGTQTHAPMHSRPCSQPVEQQPGMDTPLLDLHH